MKIEPGYWKTRDGDKVHVLGRRDTEDAETGQHWVGYVYGDDAM
jgi:hypothetical protein